MKILVINIFLVISLTFGIWANDIGSIAPGFSLPDARSGKTVSLSDFPEAKAIAVIFVATRCPYSNAFNQVMNDLAAEYKSKGVVVLGINSNGTEPVEEVAKHSEENNFSFSVLKDEGFEIADRYGAQVTPEVFLLDSRLQIQYHGALGNSKQPTTKASEANFLDLKQALDALLESKEIPVQTTKMFGCSIKRQK